MDRVGVPIKIKCYEDNCSICYELWNEISPWVYPCGHMICERCYLKQKAINRKCHMCRKKYDLRHRNKKSKEKKKKEIKNDIEETIESEYSNMWTNWSLLE